MDDKAKQHLTAVLHTDQQLRALIESTQRTREFTWESVASAIQFQNWGRLLETSQLAHNSADAAVTALITAQPAIEDLVRALTALRE